MLNYFFFHNSKFILLLFNYKFINYFKKPKNLKTINTNIFSRKKIFIKKKNIYNNNVKILEKSNYSLVSLIRKEQKL